MPLKIGMDDFKDEEEAKAEFIDIRRIINSLK